VKNKPRNWILKLGALLLALAMLAAACGDSSGDDTASSGDTSAPATTADSGGGGDTTAPPATTAAPATTADGGDSMTNALADICPNPLIIQTDWFPQAEHGYVYNLIGPDGVVDADNGTYTGPLGDTGIDVQIRAGGPYIGFSPPSAQFYSDPDIFMAFVDTATAIRDSGTLPVVAVYAAWQKSPQMLMFDPDKFDFNTIAEIGDAGTPVLYFEGSAFMDFFIGQGILSQNQVDGSYDGGPSRFITEDVVQQGFVTNEPWRYQNEYTDFGKPVKSLLNHDAGFEIYEGTLSVKPESITEDRACLEKIVPMVQQSHADYMANPGPMNDRLEEIITELNSFWTDPPGLNDYAVNTMKDLGLMGDGPDGYTGNMDEARIQKLIDEFVPILQSLGVDSIKPGLKASDLFTNEFLDTSISLGF